MFRNFAKNRFLAIFIAAFLCLNLSGSMCLVHCQWMDMEMHAEKEHCPLAKMDKEHCPNSEESAEKLSQTNLGDENIEDCCNLAMTPTIAKLEKQQVFSQATVKSEKPLPDYRPVPLVKNSYITDFSYRKPPKDKRSARLKNCVFLI